MSSHTFIEPTERGWGKKLSDGTWNGMIGMLHRNEVDLAIGPFVVTEERAQVIEYTKQLTDNYLGIIGGRQRQTQFNMFSFILAFNWQVWCGMISSFLLFTFTLSLVQSVISRPENTAYFRLGRFMKIWRKLLLDVFFNSPGFIGTYLSWRLVMGIWWLAVLVLIHAFGGQLKAAMAVHKEPPRINTLYDLSNKPHIRPVLRSGGAYSNYFQMSLVGHQKKVWSQLKNHFGLVDPSEVYTLANFQSTVRQSSVILGDLVSSTYAISQICYLIPGGKFYLGRERFYRHPLAMAVQKNSHRQLLKRINTVLTRLTEGGFIEHWIWKVKADWMKCEDRYSDTEGKTLSFTELRATFAIWLIGVTIATVVLVLEYVSKLDFSRRFKMR
ncbi:glutamate receptor 2-like [Limulus polyphemus]|uniref:Glutamate receptor 2-like n=1 Tax=Limulus polyphemus TaxID=6850 RepID=A0ABM1S6K1_LIMPO|nr:glutamate receptor 2-like [Limulus polyphemus]